MKGSFPQANSPAYHQFAVVLACLGAWIGPAVFSAAKADDAVVIVGTIVSGLTNQIARHACHDFSIILSNASSQTVTGLSATLGTLTSGTEISVAKSAYSDIPAGGVRTNTQPFKLGTAGWFVCGTPIDLVLTVTSTNAFTNSLSLQQTTPTNCLEGAGACPSTNILGGGISASDAMQVGRLNRTDPPIYSTCLTPKDCPGIITNEVPLQPRRYDAYAFINRSGESTCITVSLKSACSQGAAPMYSAAYANYFNPANFCENYLGDLGKSPLQNQPLTYSFTVAAASRFVVTAFEINPNAGCANYTLNVSSPVGFVDYQPPLQISHQSRTVIVSWPTNAANYTLESTDALAVNPFTVETNRFSILGESLQLTNSSGEPDRYYRLRKP